LFPYREHRGSFLEGFYLVIQFKIQTIRSAHQPAWVNRAPSEEAAFNEAGTHSRPVRNHPKTYLKETEMTVSKLLSAIALAVIAASGAAHAETYQGVTAVSSQQSREAVNGQAIVAARSGNIYGDAAGEGVTQLSGRSTDRAGVRAEAVETAQSANQNLDRKAFVNSVVPSQYKIQRTNTRQAGL